MSSCFIESMLNIAEDENKLFESMLKIDFRKAQVLKEADDDVIEGEYREIKDDNKSEENEKSDSANNTAKVKMIDKIKEGLKKFFESVCNFFKNLATKIKEIVLSDNKVIKLYKDALANKDNLKGFPGIANFAAPNVGELPVGAMEALGTDFMTGEWGYDIDKFKNACNDIVEASKKAISEKVELWNQDGNANFNFNDAFEEFANKLASGAGTIYKSFAQYTNSKTMARFDKISNSKFYTKTISKILDNAGLDISVEDYLKLYKEALGAFAPACKEFMSAYQGYFKGIRHALIVCGTYAIKASKGKAGAKAKAEDQAQTESLCWVTDLTSEQFLDEQFSFI